MWYFCPRPCRRWEGAGSDPAVSSPKESKAGGGKETKTHLGEEEINPPPKPVPPSPSGLIYSDFLRLCPLLSQFPAIPRCCIVWLARSFQQNGEGAGFPWENMPWDAIRAKNMWPLSSTLISHNKTQGFLPSGVSDQQEKGKSTNPWLGLKHFLARSPALSWRKLPGLWWLQWASGWLLPDSLGSAHPRLPHILI